MSSLEAAVGGVEMRRSYDDDDGGDELSLLDPRTASASVDEVRLSVRGCACARSGVLAAATG